MQPKIPGGYILVSRKMIDSEIWDKPPIYMKVWMYLLMRAQYKPYKNLERGELVVSIPEIIEACSYKVGYRTEKPSKSQIFNVLEWLRSSDEGSDEDDANETMIETTKTTRGMVVNISNYNVYQDPKSYEQNDEQNNEKTMKTTMPKRQANTINKNLKKELRTKEVIKTSRKQVYDEESPPFILATFFFKQILKNDPKRSKPNMQKWSDDIRKMIELDKRDKKEVGELMRWVQQDDFEKANVLSPSKLRTRYTSLLLKMDNPRSSNVTNIKPPVYERGNSLEKHNEQHTGSFGNVKLYK